MGCHIEKFSYNIICCKLKQTYYAVEFSFCLTAHKIFYYFFNKFFYFNISLNFIIRLLFTEIGFIISKSFIILFVFLTSIFLSKL